jgi:hypothetical protein
MRLHAAATPPRQAAVGATSEVDGATSHQAEAMADQNCSQIKINRSRRMYLSDVISLFYCQIGSRS